MNRLLLKLTAISNPRSRSGTATLRVGMGCGGFYLAAARLANGTWGAQCKGAGRRVADRRHGGEFFNVM
jgi:hypothetical protein